MNHEIFWARFSDNSTNSLGLVRMHFAEISINHFPSTLTTISMVPNTTLTFVSIDWGICFLLAREFAQFGRRSVLGIFLLRLLRYTRNNRVILQILERKLLTRVVLHDVFQYLLTHETRFNRHLLERSHCLIVDR